LKSRGKALGGKSGGKLPEKAFKTNFPKWTLNGNIKNLNTAAKQL
jgi:hypothetical protein